MVKTFLPCQPTFLWCLPLQNRNFTNFLFLFVWRLPNVYSRGYRDSSQIGMYFVIFPWNTFIGKGKGISCHTPPPLPDINSLLFCSLLGKFGPFSLLPSLLGRNFSFHMNFFWFWWHPLGMSLLLTFQTTLHILCVVTCYFVFDDILHVILYVILHVILHVIFMSSYMSGIP